MKIKKDNLFKVERERIVLLDHLHEMVFHFRLDGNFFFVNSVWMKKLGYDKWEAAELGFQDILREDQLHKWHKIQHRLAHGAGYAALDFIFRTKKNEELIVQGSLYPMSEEGEDRHAIVGIFEDETPIRQAEKERDRLFKYSIDMLCIMN